MFDFQAHSRQADLDILFYLLEGSKAGPSHTQSAKVYSRTITFFSSTGPITTTKVVAIDCRNWGTANLSLQGPKVNKDDYLNSKELSSMRTDRLAGHRQGCLSGF